MHEFRDGRDGRFGDEAGIAGNEGVECRFEGGDGRLGDALLHHFNLTKAGRVILFLQIGIVSDKILKM